MNCDPNYKDDKEMKPTVPTAKTTIIINPNPTDILSDPDLCPAAAVVVAAAAVAEDPPVGVAVAVAGAAVSDPVAVYPSPEHSLRESCRTSAAVELIGRRQS
jgi:hypothetical protein